MQEKPYSLFSRFLFTAVLFLALTPLATTNIEASEISLNQEQAIDLKKTFGVFTAQNMYLIYARVGTTADFTAESIIPPEVAHGLLDQQAYFIKVNRQQIEKLMTHKLMNEGDNVYFGRCLEAYESLRDEITMYKRYIDSRDDVDYDRYNLHRRKAQKIIYELMGLPLPEHDK